MELIKNFFNNQWVINIGTGLVVYIVTNIISRIILNKAANKEKQKQIENANKEIIRILKPYVVENNILNKNVINAVIKSISRKFYIPSEDLFSDKEICEELIREILESSYVNNDKKFDYINYLSNIMKEDFKRERELEKIQNVFLQYRYQANKKDKLYNVVSTYMIFIVIIISSLVTLFSESKIESLSNLSQPMQIGTLIIIVEISLATSLLCIRLFRNSEKKVTDKKKE